jgi:Holliday junction DNA helicase RuvA
MIAAVRGEVMVRRADHVVIDAGGVGYRLAVSAETLKAVPAAGNDAFLHAELISREDSLALYGFASEEERDLFRLLISVSGVGPKVAIAALSGGSARDLLRAIAAGDAKRFQAVPGIGKRTSERIIVELREKVAGALEEEVLTAAAEGGDARALARDGLVNLGYAPLEAEQLLDGLDSAEPQQLIASALRKAASARSGT